MATLNELAKRYAERLKTVDQRRCASEFNEIKREIDELHYERTFRSLTNDDKAKIYEGIKSELVSGMRGFSRSTLAECANDELMELIDKVLRSMGR